MPFKNSYNIKNKVTCLFICLDAYGKNLIPDELAKKFENRIASWRNEVVKTEKVFSFDSFKNWRKEFTLCFESCT